MTIRLLVAAGASLLAAVPSAAHHAASAIYDVAQELAIEGTVAEFRFVNPHIRIYVDVATDSGEVEQWLAEGGTPIVLVRLGWSGEEVRPGDRIRIEGNPGRDGAKTIRMLTLTLPGGQELAAEDVNFEAIDRRRRR